MASMSRARSKLAIGSLLTTSVVLGAGAAVAVPSAPSRNEVVDYVADPECPERDRFLALLEGALDPLERVRAQTTPGLRIRVEIRGGFGGYRGALERVDELGASAPRVIVSPACADVAQALALTAAFSLAPAATPATPAVIERRVPTPAPRRLADAEEGPGRWTGGVRGVVGSWLSNGPMEGLAAGGGRAVPFGGTAHPLTVSLRLRTMYVRNDWIGGTPDARFALWTGTLEACAQAGPFWRRLEVGLCASGESGWLRGQGVRIAHPGVSDSLWLAFGGGPLVGLRLGRRWEIEVGGAAQRPLRRAHFAFDIPAQSIADTPAVAWTVALGLVARFP